MIDRRTFLKMAGAAVPAIGLPAPSSAARAALKSGRLPNLLLIVAEDYGLQARCYGDTGAHTPNLDALAASGTRFTRAWTTQAVCSPARSSLLTGIFPHENGQIGLATHGFSTVGAPWNLIRMLTDARYRTALFGKLHVNPENEFPYQERWSPPEAISFAHRDMRRVGRAAEDFFSGSAGSPFFLNVSLPDAHLPFLDESGGEPPPTEQLKSALVPAFVGVDSARLRRLAAGYYNCIRRLDSGVGRIMDALRRTGNADHTLVVFVADHGPQFSRGKGTCYQGGLQVPLIIKPPAGTRTRSRRRVDTPVSMIDLFPTMADYCGLAEDREWPGLSLRPLMDNFRGWNREFIFAEWTCSSRAQWFPQRCVRDHRYKLIRTMTDVRPCPAALRYAEARDWVSGTAPAELVAASTKVKRAYHEWENPPREQLFDLQNDPSEWVNLAGSASHAAAHRRLASALARWQIATQDVVSDAASARPPPPG